MTDAFFYRMLGILCDSATLACQIQGSPDQRGALTTAAPAAVPPIPAPAQLIIIIYLVSVVGNICSLKDSRLLASPHS